MAKFISNDLSIYLSVAKPTVIAADPTGITKTSPPVITCADTTGMAAGDMVAFKATGFDELDNKMFVVKSVPDGTSYDIVGADLTASVGVFTAASAKGVVTGITDLVKICLRELDIGAASTSEVDTSTFCAAGSLPGPSTPGPVSFTGYVDITTDAYKALKDAADDKVERLVKFVGPDNQYWVGKVTIGDLSWAFPRGDVVTFVASGTQSLKLEHIF